ncbi:MAG: cation:proton antiporter subunit C [Vallitaleaceae bacterium]|jgi:multicomponent Na+:H+ antiporter subunit C|nr:cation:proton antiporter subunit C [Vallitaleaceae bacterium]
MTLSFGEIIALILFCVGFYGLLARRNIIRTIISLGIIQVAIILFFLAINFESTMIPPIGVSDPSMVADPLPQALMITAIVIGVSVTAVALTMFISLYHRYGSTNWMKVKKKRRDES